MSANIISNIQEEGKVSITESITGKSKEFPINIMKGKNELEFLFIINDPELWWPVGHGDQPLYDIDIQLHLDNYEQKFKKRIGLREVCIHRQKDEKGESFEIHINLSLIHI